MITGESRKLIDSLATTYGGTVRRFEMATEYPNPRIIEGKKNEIP